MIKGKKIKLPGLDRMWRPATKEEMRLFDEAAIKILSEVGVHIDDKECINTFKDTPVEIDEKELIIKIPEYWIRDMLRKAPSTFMLAGRIPKNDMSFTGPGHDQYCGITSAATKMFIWNEEKSQWDSIDPGIDEVIYCAKITDALDCFDSFYASPVTDIQSTKKGLPAEVHTQYGKLVGSTKNIGGAIITEGGITEWDFVAQLCATVQGGFDELKKRPIVMGLPSAIGPLQVTRQNFWALQGPAKYHLPTAPYYGGTQPFTAPATMAGAIALAIACNYFLVATSQFLDPGTPTIPTAFHLAAQPSSGQLAFCPYWAWSYAVQAQIYHEMLNLPICEYANSITSSLEEQTAHMMSQYLIATIQGTNWIMVDPSPQAFMLETFVMCEEIINFCKQMIFQFNDYLPTEENLALDVIKEVGPKKHFTTHKHTLKYIDPKLGLYWHGNTWETRHADKWRNDGAKRWLYDTARERIKELEKHEPEPLSKDIIEKMDKIVAEADEKLALF
ncbi:MAG: trimethylamine methyltransferase family protein [Candidatus Helarchaeota archaeon]